MRKTDRGKRIFKLLGTGRIDEQVACVRERVANIFFYRKNGQTIGIGAGEHRDRSDEKTCRPGMLFPL